MRGNVDVLISIRPEYVARIINGEKKYEFRKRIFKQHVRRIFIYSSAPQKRIVGYFDWDGAIAGDVSSVWEQTSKYAGIDEPAYKAYFSAAESAYAIKLNLLHLFDKPVNPWYFQGFRPPQSYCYLGDKDKNLYEKLCDLVQEERNS